VTLETRTRVILLQHPREERVPIGTARLAHLCLPGSALHVGIDFDNDQQVRAALADDPARPAYLLFPGPQALDLAVERPAGPITLVVVDGTWWQARKLLKRNAVLATVEALALTLGALEEAPERFATLLLPFEAMIDTQIRYATTVRGARRRHALHRTRKAQRPTISTMLRARAEDLVCVHGEANAWPARRPGGHPAEIVHWIARRAQTGETFEAVIKPRRPLAPAIPRHIQISEEKLAAGESWSSFRARWEAFLREDDFACSWGRYPLDLLEAEGVGLPKARLDMRPVAGGHLGAPTGSVEDCTTRLGVAAAEPFALGRGGTRLAALTAIVDKMMSL
jgi:DTW domain-containing protein